MAYDKRPSQAGHEKLVPKITSDYQSPDSRGTPVSSSHPERIGPYQILEALGEGGMGVVYLAEQKEPVRRRVALKLIKLGMDTCDVVARFESERQALALMSHASVATVFDGGATEQGRPYFVMEYVPGIPITDYCDKHRLAVRERLELFLPVCEAVQHAHHKGIIHRDLKSSNVLVMLQDGRPLPKVIDFGVAKATAGRLTERTLFTEQGRLIGTPDYMSPEQAEMTSLDIDTRTDVYSLGVMLYELLVGCLPLDLKSLGQAGYAEVQRILREVEPPKPSTRVSSLARQSAGMAPERHPEPRLLERQLRGDLDRITLKAMEKDRTRRYATPLELAADIRRHLNHEPVLARPPSVGYRLGKFVRKHKGLVAAAAAVFLVLIVGIVVTTSLYFQADAARREAALALKKAELARQSERVQRELAEDRFFALEGIIAITPPEAKRLLDSGEGYVYLDVRTEGEFSAGHVPGALNIPLAHKDASTGQMKMNKRFLTVARASVPAVAPVIVGCRSGERSAKATYILLKDGYKHVYNMNSGFVGSKDETGRVLDAGWSMLDFPVERGDGDARSYKSLSAKANPPP